VVGHQGGAGIPSRRGRWGIVNLLDPLPVMGMV
jgi:hypothetical protein